MPPIVDNGPIILLFTPIYLYSQWQREQVDKYCTKHGRDKLALTLPTSTHSKIIDRRNLFRHLIFDDKRKLIFCFIPKVILYITSIARTYYIVTMS